MTDPVWASPGSEAWLAPPGPDVDELAREIPAGWLRPLRRVEYDKLVELGVFDEDPHVELLCGRLVRMSPQGSPHAAIAARLLRRLVLALGHRAWVRPAMPVAATDDSEPEPDIAIVDEGDNLAAHPSTAHLAIEVSVSSLRIDLRVKRRLYAAAGVREYWVVDVAHRRVHVHRQPERGDYRDVTTHGPEASLALLAFPDVVVPCAELLPELPT